MWRGRTVSTNSQQHRGELSRNQDMNALNFLVTFTAIVMSRSRVETSADNLITLKCHGTSNDQEFQTDHDTTAQISHVSTAKIDPDPFVMICEAKNNAGKFKAFVQVEILLARRKPTKQMVVETYQHLLQRIENLILNCSYDFRSNNISRKNLKHKVSYSCDVLSFHVYLTDNGRRRRQSRSTDTVHGERIVGELCTTKDNNRGRFMLKENGALDCLQCHQNTHWNPEEEACSPCPPYSSRSKPHVFPKCIDDDELQRPSTAKPPILNMFETTTSPVVEIPGFLNETEINGNEILHSPLPEQIRVESINATYAVLKWCQFACASKYGNSSLKISLYEWSKSCGTAINFTTEVDATMYTLTSLKPNTSYCVSIQQLHAYGDGPMSKVIEFRTHRELEHPTDVRIKEEAGFIEVTWSRPNQFRDLSIMVTFSRVDSHGSVYGNVSFSPPKYPKIRFGLPDLHRYRLSIHYYDDQRHGPKSVTKTVKQEQNERCSCFPLYILLIILGVAAVRLISFCFLTR